MVKRIERGAGKGAWRSWAVPGALLALALLADTASAECLSKPVAGPGGTTAKQRILAPRSEIARYEALGYRVEACTAGVEKIRQSIAMLCTAQALQLPVLRAGDARRGVSLEELCASARAAVAEMELRAAGGQ
jgi:hypothetical protein